MKRKQYCMIVDDDPETVKLLKAYVRQTTGLAVAHAGTDARKALERLHWMKVNILIIDMEMPKINGLDFLAQIRERVRGNVPGAEPLKVIVCSAHRSYAFDTFSYYVSDYLLKPLSFPRFIDSIDRVRRELMVQPSATALAGKSSLLLIRKDRAQKVRVDFDEIIYLQADDGYCRVFVGEKEHYTAKQPLKDLLMLLPREQFVHIHKSFAVSYDYIDCVNGDSVKLRHIDEPIPIGDRKHYPDFARWDESNTV